MAKNNFEKDKLARELAFPSFLHYERSPLFKKAVKYIIGKKPKCKCGNPSYYVVWFFYTIPNMTGKSDKYTGVSCKYCFSNFKAGKDYWKKFKLD